MNDKKKAKLSHAVPDVSAGMVGFELMPLRFRVGGGDGNCLEVLDQRQLPDTEHWIRCAKVEDMFVCIREMCVRGAPMIGIAASMMLAQWATEHAGDDAKDWHAGLLGHAARLRESRPTAVNLMYCIDAIVSLVGATAASCTARAADVRRLAYQMMVDEQNYNEGMAELGAALVAPGEGIMTHCNTGSLATAGVGTALGVVRAVYRRHGAQCPVFVGETRPLLQGGRLTTYELTKSGVPFTLLCDSMAAQLMRAGKIHRVFVGADRIARNGDSANKIGTYGLAVLARHHNVPFHIVAPTTTVDLGCPNGDAIPIEERRSEEVRGVCANVVTNAPPSDGAQPTTVVGGVRWAPAGAVVANPAFDVTPANLITSWVFGDQVVTYAQLEKANHDMTAFTSS